MSDEDMYLKKLRLKKMKELLSQKQEEFPADGRVYDLDEHSFNKIIQSRIPVVVDFWAEWCIPCRYMHPIIEYLAKKYIGKVKFARINVDYYPDIARQFMIMGVPTFLIFKNGKLVDRIVGAVGAGLIERAILKYINGE